MSEPHSSRGGGWGVRELLFHLVSRLYEHTSIIVTRFKIRADEPEGNLRTSWRSASVNADGVFFVKHQRADSRITRPSRVVKLPCQAPGSP